MLVLLPVVFLRLSREFAARSAAETRIEAERHYDAAHAKALTLYNEEFNRERVLEGTLALLAADPLFPVSVFYGHEEWGGHLRVMAAHGAPADIRQVMHVDDGPIGKAARQGSAVYIEGFDASTGLTIETGLATLKPAALLLAPVCYRGKLAGVLALAAARPLSERDRSFIDRLASQLGVALHNLTQLEEVKLLAEQLRSRGRDIQSKNDELERASRMKSEFLANMSHELRTPLNAVIGFSEILKDGLLGPLPEEPRRYIGEIHTSGKHLLSLINDILDLSKVEAGHMAIDPEPVDLAAVGRGAMSVVSEKAMTRGIALSHHWVDDIGTALLDARKTKQILFNLLSNAVKFSPDNGAVSLSIRRVGRDTVDETLRSLQTGGRAFAPPADHDEFVELSVTDNGIGISEEGLARLFQPFMQLDSSLSRHYEGTGLGLTMVKRLAELHGGSLGVSSRSGHGSTFFVWLPWIEEGGIASQASSRDRLPSAPVAFPADPPADRAPLHHGESARPADPAQDAATVLAAPSDPISIDGTAAEVAAQVGRDLPAAARAENEPAPLILIVEDNPLAADLMKLQLTANGYRVAVTRTAEGALEMARSLAPQALILDVLLPDTDGWDLLSRLKDSPDTAQVPVVIVSITDQPRRGFALGAAQVLVKPVSQQDLLTAIASLGIGANSGEQPSNVLVADDDPRAVDLVSRHLREGGFLPLPAYGGQEAVDLARRHRPSLIVLDLMMPGMSGLDVIETLSRHPDTSEIPVVVLTAKLLTQADRIHLRGRVQAVVEKSEFTSRGLLAEVKRAVSRHRAAPAHH
jgi:signal transduction histidine kinase/CheY-like chemotaxis protein